MHKKKEGTIESEKDTEVWLLDKNRGELFADNLPLYNAIVEKFGLPGKDWIRMKPYSVEYHLTNMKNGRSSPMGKAKDTGVIICDATDSLRPGIEKWPNIREIWKIEQASFKNEPNFIRIYPP